jgi:hypothetical protein
MIDPSVIAAISASTIAGVVWAVRQEGRINNLVALTEERDRDIQTRLLERQKVDDERHAENKQRLQRIEAKLDWLKPRQYSDPH